MAAPAYLLDTNILLRLSLPGGPHDEVVVSAVERLVAEEATLFYTLQNAAEFWRAGAEPLFKLCGLARSTSDLQNESAVRLPVSRS
jgi:hypothetical protein